MTEKISALFTVQFMKVLFLSKCKPARRRACSKVTKKQREKEVLTVARIKATAISSKIGQYRIEADSFIWDRSKENFKS